MKGKTIEDTDIYLSYQEYKEMLQLGPDFEKLTPMKRIERLNDPHLDRNIVDLLLKKTGAKLNIIRSVKGPLRSVVSGINNYIRFNGRGGKNLVGYLQPGENIQNVPGAPTKGMLPYQRAN